MLRVIDDYSSAKEESEESALIQAAREEPSAFGELYKRYLKRIYCYLRARADSDEDAADLTQQVFLQALKALPRYRQRGLPFAAWLFRMASNVATDAWRHRKVTVNWDSLPEAVQESPANTRNPWANPEAIALQKEAIVRLSELLAGLEQEKRELLLLRFAAQLTTREIAALLGKSEAAIQKQIYRLLQSLKEQYDEQ